MYVKHIYQDKDFIPKCLFWLANRNLPARKEILAEMAEQFRMKLQNYLSRF